MYRNETSISDQRYKLKVTQQEGNGVKDTELKVKSKAPSPTSGTGLLQKLSDSLDPGSQVTFLRSTRRTTEHGKDLTKMWFGADVSGRA